MTLKVWSCGALVVFGALAEGCSDPVPPAARGAFSYTITTCQQYTAGVAKGGNVPTTQGSGFAGERLVDGESDSDISCAVKGGPPFNIAGSIRGNNSHPAATFTGEHIEFALSNGQITETGLGTADVTLYAGQVYKSQTAKPCTLSVVERGNLEVASGRIFATFNCGANLDVSGSPVTDCSANGVFVFERCDE